MFVIKRDAALAIEVETLFPIFHRERRERPNYNFGFMLLQAKRILFSYLLKTFST